MPLNDLNVRNAKARDRAYKLSDGEGLYVLVRKNGTKAWQLGYRFAGKQKTYTIGPYPAIGLAEAREKRTAAKKLLTAGKDPSIEKQRAKLVAVASAENTFDVIAEEWLTMRRETGAAERTIEKHRWLIDLATPDLGKLPVNEIAPAEVLHVLKKVEKSGRLESARRLRATCGEIFRYAIRTARATSDPTQVLQGATQAPTVTHRPALLEEKPIGKLIRDIRALDGRFVIRTGLMFSALTFVRPEEVRFARKPEFDLTAAMWLIPGERMKMGLPHYVPLARQTVDLLHEIFEVQSGNLLFPSPVKKIRDQPISENALNMALRRMGYEGVMTSHGFRRMASTLLNEKDFNRDWVERQLAHKDENEVRRAYNAAEYLPGRIKMMQFWADLLDRLAAQLPVEHMVVDDDEDLIG